MMMMDFMGVEENHSEDIQQEEQKDQDWLMNSGKVCTKSLEELTDQDVMQLTREDCRRYLKQKGMRRPSWNKAQAVQQVLSLRGLGSIVGKSSSFNSSGTSKRSRASDSEDTDLAATKTLKVDTQQQQPSTSQLTMFYGGTVSVFENVPADKAYSMMLLAADVSSWPPSGRILRSLEMPQARKASLQRFLHRRKERWI